MAHNSQKQTRTLAAQLGFQDPDLRTSEHDALMVWLDGMLHNPRFLRDLTQTPQDDATPAPELVECTWEYAVGDSRWTAGFIDIYAQVDAPHAPPPEDGTRYWSTVYSYAFEVKTTIPSLGELIRQVRFYEAKKPSPLPVFYVVSPEHHWATSLRGQGIGFVAVGSAMPTDETLWAVGHPRTTGWLGSAQSA